MSVLGARPPESDLDGASGSDRSPRFPGPPRAPSAGPGLRDLTFAAALASAAGRMHGALNVADLWASVVSEAVALIPADAAALIQFRQPAWRLLATRPSDAHPSAAATDKDIAAIVQHGLLSQTNSLIEPSSLPPTDGISWPALLIARLAGVSRRTPLRLVWFSRSPSAFAGTIDIAGIFTGHVDAAVESAQARDTLQEAVAARHRIGIAQGILMNRHDWTAEQAFSVLQRVSQHTNMKLRSVADRVIDTGELLDHSTASPPSAFGKETR